MNTRVNICGVELKNPVIAASGTFGFGREYNEFYDVGMLGGISSKGLTLLPREGNDGVRIAETPSGILNCVGLQNPGVEAFIERELPFMRESGAVVIANAAGSSLQDYEKICERLSETDVDMIELNISCPNVRCGGMSFGVLPSSVEEVTRAARSHCSKPLIVKLTPQRFGHSRQRPRRGERRRRRRFSHQHAYGHGCGRVYPPARARQRDGRTERPVRQAGGAPHGASGV